LKFFGVDAQKKARTVWDQVNFDLTNARCVFRTKPPSVPAQTGVTDWVKFKAFNRCAIQSSRISAGISSKRKAIDRSPFGDVARGSNFL